jgi:hypothetical protein
MLKLIFIYTVAVFCGLMAATGIGALIGFLWPAADIPTTIVLSGWWLWIGWEYACLRDKRPHAAGGNFEAQGKR